jgi:hypothetical protein
MPSVTPAQIKGLFYHLVRQVGGVEAAAAYLEISHQRVSQLQNAQTSDMPTIMHVVTLEAVVGQDVVTGVLSRAATGAGGRSDLTTEACEAVEASAEVLRLVRTNADPKTLRQAALRLVREAEDVTDHLARNDRAESA